MTQFETQPVCNYNDTFIVESGILLVNYYDMEYSLLYYNKHVFDIV